MTTLFVFGHIPMVKCGGSCFQFCANTTIYVANVVVCTLNDVAQMVVTHFKILHLFVRFLNTTRSHENNYVITFNVAMS